jgi:hypothetical protein
VATISWSANSSCVVIFIAMAPAYWSTFFE